MLNSSRFQPAPLARLTFWTALALLWAVGMLARGYWTPDEPREADITWRMGWQGDRAVPLLAGEAFCEKPPLTYWIAAPALELFGNLPWAARLPNLLYALVTALAVGALARRSAGAVAGWVAAAAISTLLLAYQVAIWLATDAPLLACIAVALLGAYRGFYAAESRERLTGYTLMHGALALGFLAKSAAGWMVPALAIMTLVIWERRWRELWRWELYVGLLLQAVLILSWVGWVYTGVDGQAHLKVFFWNNLVGRFATVDAPAELQYTTAHRNTPGKYFVELPVYLWPWTLLVAAAVRRAWRERRMPFEEFRSVRFAVATFVPTLGVLSLAATARNIYLAPALPGVALLLGWWVQRIWMTTDRWDLLALRATAGLLLVAVVALSIAVGIATWDSWSTFADSPASLAASLTVSVAGLSAAAILAWLAERDARRTRILRAAFGLLLSYCLLSTAPASQIFRVVDRWQNLQSIGAAIARDSVSHPLILFAADETTRALIDMYVRPTVQFIPGPIDATAIARLQSRLQASPQSVVVALLPIKNLSPVMQRLTRRRTPTAPNRAVEPAWAAQTQLSIAQIYALPNGRVYALLVPTRAMTSR